MTRIRTNVRVTELDSLSDTLVRLYKGQEALAQDAMLKSIMAEIEEQSARLTTAIRRDAVSSTLEEADARRDEEVRLLGTLVEGYTAFRSRRSRKRPKVSRRRLTSMERGLQAKVTRAKALS